MASKSLLRHLRHLKPIGELLPFGVVASLATYVVAIPLPLYIDGKLDNSPTFSAHAHGLPLAFVQAQCFGAPLHCSNYFDGWAFVFNTAIWTLIVGVGWWAFKRLRKPHPRHH